MRANFFIRYLIVFIIFLTSILLIVYIIGVRKIRQHYLQTLTMNLMKISRTLLPLVRIHIEDNNYEELDKIVKDIGNKIEVRITVIDENGKVLADTKSDPVTMENHRNRIEIEEALKGNIGTSIRYSSTINEDMLYLAIPIVKENKVRNVLRMSVFLKDVNILLKEFRKDLLLSLIALSFGILIIYFIFFTKWNNSMNNIMQFSKRVAEGDFSARILSKPGNEFKNLIDSLNYMNDKMRELFKKLREEKEQFQILINSINELLFVIDSKGKIVLSNDSFRDFVGDNTAEGKYYWEVIRNKDIIGLVQKMKEGLNKEIIQMQLSEKVYSCSVAKLKLSDETIFILTDVTPLYLLDKIKKDFVENVSHELRTPLTAVKGFLEALEQEAEEKNQYYISIIKKNTERLIKIVNDLLTLSSLENRNSLIVFDKVNLINLVKDIASLFKNRIKDKDLIFDVSIEEGIPEIEGDEIQLESMLINLVENAINYTDKGRISLSVVKDDNYIKIEVSDTGIGIPEEDIGRIFERFYVVDKSRSRKSGGSGLGLSIVKHIVLMHDGTIDVKSEIGKGTTFVIKLKIST